ncbi:hypothetical protein QBC39DRAFT_338671 [Podospora conica]|nr:hypothetical protein QBC39DRAFT_338671 [Schizothecium conicum]
MGKGEEEKRRRPVKDSPFILFPALPGRQPFRHQELEQDRGRGIYSLGVPPLAPLEAEGREQQQQRDGHGDDDGINHTHGWTSGGEGGGVIHSPAAARGYTNGESGWAWQMGSSLEAWTKQTRLGLVWKPVSIAQRRGCICRKATITHGWHWQTPRPMEGGRQGLQRERRLVVPSVGGGCHVHVHVQIQGGKKGQERNAQRYGGSTGGGKV